MMKRAQLLFVAFLFALLGPPAFLTACLLL
jgi:hypothetical protein